MRERQGLGRRILVALDASSDSLAALEMAALMATVYDAELHGIYVEDADLLRVAALPEARMVGAVSGTRRGLADVHMERALRAVAARAQRALVAAAGEARVPWAFRVARGVVSAELLKAADDAELVVLGRSSRASGRVFVGSTAHAIVSGAAPPVLVLKRRLRRGRPIMVMVTDAEEASVSLEAATALARALDGSLVVVLPAREPDVPDRLAREVKAHLAGTGWTGAVAYRRMVTDDLRGLLQAIQHEDVDVVVANLRSTVGGERSMPDVARHVPTSVLLVR